MLTLIAAPACLFYDKLLWPIQGMACYKERSVLALPGLEVAAAWGAGEEQPRPEPAYQTNQGCEPTLHKLPGIPPSPAGSSVVPAWGVAVGEGWRRSPTDQVQRNGSPERYPEVVGVSIRKYRARESWERPGVGMGGTRSGRGEYTEVQKPGPLRGTRKWWPVWQQLQVILEHEIVVMPTAIPPMTRVGEVH